MRRLALFVTMVLILGIPAFAAFSPNSDESVQNPAFVINGYFEGEESNKSIVLSITDFSNARVYQTGTGMVYAQSAESGEGLVEEINRDVFNWSLTGNFSGSASIKFTFSALMAYVESQGGYFVPEHRFIMNLDNGSEFSIVNAETNMAAFDHKAFANYPYAEYSTGSILRTIKYTGTKNLAENETSWTESGVCGVQISDYAYIAGIVFHYMSNVSVEVTVP